MFFEEASSAYFSTKPEEAAAGGREQFHQTMKSFLLPNGRSIIKLFPPAVRWGNIAFHLQEGMTGMS